MMIKIFVFVLSLCPGFVGAEIDSASKEALDQTVEVLRDPQKRQKSFGENPQYKQGESAVEMLVRGNEAQKQQLYELAAEVLQTLATQAQGDPVKMQEIISQAQRNPAQFLDKYLSEVQKKQVKDLASQVEKSREPQAPKPAK